MELQDRDPGAPTNDQDRAKFHRLAETALLNIFTFLTHSELKRLERTCKRFHALLAAPGNDQVWERSFCGPRPAGVYSHREWSGICYNLTHLPSTRENAIVSVIGGKGMANYLDRVRNAIQPGTTRLRDIEWRGDTVAVVAEILSSFLISLLQKAYTHNLRAVRCQGTHSFTVDCRDLESVEGAVLFTRRNTANQFNLNEIEITQIHGVDLNLDFCLDDALRDRIVRRISLLAGIPKMSNGAIVLVGRILVTVTAGLVHQLVLRSKHYVRSFSEHACVLDDKENDTRIDLWNTPVLNIGHYYGWFGTRTVFHLPEGRAVPIPRMVEEAARDLGLNVQKVYGNPWVAQETGRSEQEEREAALAQYVPKVLNQLPKVHSELHCSDVSEESGDESDKDSDAWASYDSDNALECDGRILGQESESNDDNEYMIM